MAAPLRHKEVWEALQGAVCGQQGADEWIVQQGASIAVELADALLGKTAAPAPVPVRQLAGLVLARLVSQKEGCPDAVQAMAHALKQDVLVMVQTQQDPALLKVGCAVLAGILKQVSPDGVEEVVSSCAAGYEGGEAALRLLLALAAPGGNAHVPRVFNALYQGVVFPALAAPATPRSAAAVRTICHSRPTFRPQVAAAFPAFLDSVPADSFPAITDVFRTAELLPATQLAPAVYSKSVQVFTYYGHRILAGTHLGSLQDPVIGYSSEVTAVQACINAVAAVVSSATPPDALLEALPWIIVCAAPNNLEEFDEDEEESVLDCARQFDPPATLRDSAVWLVSLLVKDPDNDGPSPPIPGIHDYVARVLITGIREAEQRRREASLLTLQKLCEAQLLSASLPPLQDLLSLSAAPATPASTRARAALAAASLGTNTLPPEQHAHLINCQWRQLCEQGAPTELKVALAVGVGMSVSHLVSSKAAVQHVSIGPSLAPILEVLHESPLHVVDAVNNLLQVLPATFLTPENAAAAMTGLLEVMSRNESNTRLCSGIMRVICQGIIEEHTPGPICEAVLRCSGLIMSTVLSPTASPSLQALAPNALDLASTLCLRKCSCSSVSGQLVGSIAGAAGGFEGKLAVRAGLRAFTLACSAQPPPDPEVVFAFIAPRVVDRTFDLATRICAAAACSSLCTHLRPPQLAQLAASCNAALSEYWATQKDWSWPVALCIPWCVLVVRAGVPEAMGLLGAPADLLRFLQLWLSVDAALEPPVRPSSAAAALTLLSTLGQEHLTTTVQLAQISTLRRRTDASVTAALGDALLLAVLRVTEKPLTSSTRSFLAKDPGAVACPVDPSVASRAAELIASLPPERREALEKLHCTAAGKSAT